MFKLALLLSALAAYVTVSQAAPMLAERSPPQLRCAPSSQWNNGSLSFNDDFGSPVDAAQLAIRTFQNDTTGKPEHRLSKWVEGRADLTKLTTVNSVYCNSTTFNYTYELPEADYYLKNQPLQLRTPQFDIPSGYGTNDPSCLSVGYSNWTPEEEGKLPTTGSYPISVQECETTDFQQPATTQAQLFQSVYKYGYILTANGYASGQNPPQGWYLVMDDTTGDVIATSDDPDPNGSTQNAFFITSSD